MEHIKIKAAILDTETTGLKEPVPVEVAYIDVSKLFEVPYIHRNPYSPFDKVFEYRQLFDPQKPIEFGAMATHHITNEDVAGRDPYTAFELPNVEYLIGHNIDFDWSVIQTCAETELNVVKGDVKEIRIIHNEPKRICTLAIARYLYPEIDSHKLTAMLYALDLPYAIDHAQHAHSALDDVWMTYHLLKIMLPKTKSTNFEELYQFSEMARTPKIITFGEYDGSEIKDLPYHYNQWLLTEGNIDKYLRKALELTHYTEEQKVPKVMYFGKHKGMAIKELPYDYRKWLLNKNDLDPYLRKALTS